MVQLLNDIPVCSWIICDLRGIKYQTTRENSIVRNLSCFPLSIFFFLLAQQSSVGHGLLILEVSRCHITTHHSRLDSSGRGISLSQRPLPDNTQHSQQTSMLSVGFEPPISELRLRPRGQWDRFKLHEIPNSNLSIIYDKDRFAS